MSWTFLEIYIVASNYKIAIYLELKEKKVYSGAKSLTIYLDLKTNNFSPSPFRNWYQNNVKASL